ncbi:agamous-like MADS-box protein AGL103 [Cajanus cajan]|uniref:MADS-box protein FBP24 n=1 Tax=Cajanus cajan TaxID=3821 RepID=A0A151QZ15_CAJCA|nr:agamous-like MADS-box protein AGL103 [Cajanus cajan]KYP35554.1 MADS-box protein FBP24 [Cajanus cajan]
MGRPKLILKPIPNGRDRDLAFRKRKKVLMKKMSEFSSVCGVNTCLVMYDGNGDDAPPHTWPQDPNEVHSIIARYESVKNEKLPKNFDLNNFFYDRKNAIEVETCKVKNETLKIKYPTWHPSFDNLGIKELSNFIAMLDHKFEACNQRVEMAKYKRQVEANFNFMQCMVPSEIAAPTQSQLNFMHGNGMSQNQLTNAPMKPLNDGNLVTSYPLNHDQGSCSKPPMLHFDQNLMQLMTKNKGVVVDSTNQVGGPLDCATKIDANGNSTNQDDVPADLTKLVDESLDYFSQLGEIEDLTSPLDEFVNWVSQPDVSRNWTNQHGVPMIGGSTAATSFHGDTHNHESALSNYNGGLQSMQPYNYDAALQNIAPQSQNLHQMATLPPLLPSVEISEGSVHQ